MQSPWQTDERNNVRKVKTDHVFESFERSTSAPPPETSLIFGARSSDNTGAHMNSNLNLSFLSHDQNFYSTISPRPITSNENRNQREELAPPGFTSNFLPSSSPTKTSISNGRFLNRRSDGSLMTQIQDRRTVRDGLDRRVIGENLDRPHSATPSFDGRRSAGIPPGLSSRQETPLHSNQSGVLISTAINDIHHLENTYVDRSQILQMAQRRPASTGVIGDNHQGSSSTVLNSLGIPVRPTVKTLMDLIQEDSPRESHVEAAVIYDNSSAVTAAAYHSRRAPERPRTTSPLSSQYMRHDFDCACGRCLNDLSLDGEGAVQRSIDLSQTQRRYDMNRNDALDSMNSMSRSTQNINGTSSYRANKIEQSRPIPQYATVDRRNIDTESRASFYAPVAYHPQPSRPHAINLGDHPRYDRQNGPEGYGAQPQQIETHILPSGHTVYINTAPLPPQYGYATIQYHPHPQQQQQQVPYPSHAVPPPVEKYISVVPIQGGSPPSREHDTCPGGTYTYWQPPSEHQGSSQHTFAIIPPISSVNGQKLINESKLGNKEAQHQKQFQLKFTTTNESHGCRGKDKNSKIRRSSGSNLSRRVSGNGSCSFGIGVGSGGDIKPKNATHHNVNLNGSLLEDYKSKKNNRDWTVNDVVGHVVEFCKDQNGSRFIQQRLEIGDNKEKEIVTTEVLLEVKQLRNDVFGNYVVQKLWDFGNEKIRKDLRATMTGEMVQLSMQMYGCRVVQKALECINEIYFPNFLSEFQNNVLSLIHDQNGNHVIQKCIEVISLRAKAAREENEEDKALFFGEQIDFIVGDVLNNLSTLACHPYGCRVLQRILEHCAETQKNMALENISQCIRKLFDDQYGNYVIQHVLQFGRVKDRGLILDMIIENGLLKLSRQKFASNVVEKLLKYGNAEQRKSIVREMLKIVNEKTDSIVKDETEEGTSVVLLMVRDPYANYVVQTAMDVLPDSEERRGLLEELNAHSTELKNYTFAKHIITKLDS